MNVFKVFLVSVLTFFISQANAAYVMSPTYVEIPVSKDQKKNPTRSFYIENKGKMPVALDVEIKKRIVKQDGTIETVEVKDVEKLFTFYPKKFVVKPEEKRTVRITYIGPKDVKKEENYRFIVTRVIVKHEKSKGKSKKKNAVLDLAIQYHGSIYVMPADGKPEISVTKFEFVPKGPARKKEDQKAYFGSAVKMVLKNTGNVHKLVDLYKVKIDYIDKDNKTKTVELDSKDIPVEYSVERTKASGNVLPGGTREIFFPLLKINDVKSIQNVNLSIY